MNTTDENNSGCGGSTNFELNAVVVIPIGTPLFNIEQIVLEKTLMYCKYNKTQAAKLLGISRRTIQRKCNTITKNL